MTGQITGYADGQYHLKLKSGQLTVGGLYLLEESGTGTSAQNKAFHALLNAFYAWMQKIDQFQFEDNGRIFDFRTPSAVEFRELFKYKYGAGFSHVEYVDQNYCMVRVKTLEEVPGYALDDLKEGNRGRVKGVLKSWADYTKKERKDAIDNLFCVIVAVSCDDKKVLEIKEGMSNE